ncbi:MAG: hypothetical protein LPK09_05690 [Hymenobacteraceae bacterium]|nr:hypothetical protein [Hymenobacteraceae bacterium]
MKVLFVIAATVSCFGLALKNDTKAPVSEVPASQPVVLTEVEEPVMHVLLDTVVITAVAPHAVAAK